MLNLRILRNDLEYSLKAAINLRRRFAEAGDSNMVEQLDVVISYIGNAIGTLNTLLSGGG